MGDTDYNNLATQENASKFLMESKNISILKKVAGLTPKWQHSGIGVANFFMFLDRIISKQFNLKYNDDNELSKAVLGVLLNLKNWCHNDIVTDQIQKLIDCLQPVFDAKQSIKPYLSTDIQITPDFLNFFDIPSEHQFSIFGSFDNLPGYYQLVYSFTDQVLHCPNIAYVSTSLNAIKTLGNGEMGYFCNLQYNHIPQGVWNPRNYKDINVSSYQNDLQLVFNDLAVSLCYFVKRHPAKQFAIDLQHEFVYHRVPYPHHESDDSDEEHKGEKIYAKVKVHSEIITHSLDLQTLNAQNAVSDAIIRAYSRELGLHYTKKKKEYKVLLCTETKAYENYTNKNKFDSVLWSEDYKEKDIKVAKFFVYIIYIPNQWIFYVINVENKKKVKCYCYDCFSKDLKVTGAKLRAGKWCIQNINEVYKNWEIDVIEIHDNNDVVYEGQDFPQQRDQTNSGIYALFGVKEFLEYGDYVIEFNYDQIQSFQKKVREFFKGKLREESKRLKEVKDSSLQDLVSSSADSDESSVKDADASSDKSLYETRTLDDSFDMINEKDMKIISNCKFIKRKSKFSNSQENLSSNSPDLLIAATVSNINSHRNSSSKCYTNEGPIRSKRDLNSPELLIAADSNSYSTSNSSSKDVLTSSKQNLSLSDAIQSTKNNLHCDIDPKDMDSSRLQDYEEVTNVLQEALNIKQGLFLYVCGLPGTGKTVFVRKICNKLRDSYCNTIVRQAFVDGNTMENHELYSIIGAQINILPDGNVPWGQHNDNVKEKLVAQFKPSSSRSKKIIPMTILFVDAIDMASQLCMKELINISNLAGSRLIIIGTGNNVSYTWENDIDMNCETSSNNVLIVFKDFEQNDIVRILKRRVFGNIVNELGYKLIAIKLIKYSSGDARQAIQILCQCLEYAIKKAVDHNNNFWSEASVTEAYAFVSFDDVQATLRIIGHGVDRSLVAVNSLTQSARLYLTAMIVNDVGVKEVASRNELMNSFINFLIEIRMEGEADKIDSNICDCILDMMYDIGIVTGQHSLFYKRGTRHRLFNPDDDKNKAVIRLIIEPTILLQAANLESVLQRKLKEYFATSKRDLVF